MTSTLHFLAGRREIQYRDPVLLFHRFCREQKNCLLLESAEVDSKRHLQSFLLLQAALRIRCHGNQVSADPLTANGARISSILKQFHPARRVDAADGSGVAWRFDPANPDLDEDLRLIQPSVFDPLRWLRECVSIGDGDEDAFFVAGLFAYDLVEQFEPLPAVSPNDACPDFVFYLAEKMVRIDHVNRTATAYQITLNGGKDRVAPVIRELDWIEEIAGAAADEDLPPSDRVMHEAAVDIADPQFVKIVERLKEEIAIGVVFQAVPSRSFHLPCPSPLRAYRRLRRTNPSPYMFYMDDQDFTLFGASPETAVKFSAADRVVELCPIAGTRPRGLHPNGQVDLDLDGRIELELRTDQKEMAEHLMLVDLARNDLARICEPATRHVAQLLKVDRYSHVMHLVSRLKGRLREGLDGLHAYRACMNMGTLTGAPKVQAMQLIRELEGSRRGSYGGAVGYFNGRGDFETCIVIRSAFVQNGQARVQAGAGVVHDSDPQSEADETRGKAQAVLNALRAAHLAEHQE